MIALSTFCFLVEDRFDPPTLSVLRAEVDVIRQEGTAAVNLKLARARAESQRDIEFAKARAIAQLAAAESESYAKLASELGCVSHFIHLF